MIETLSLRNFKVLREVDVWLHPLTLIVGPNASGKSSILQALSCITDVLSKPEFRWKEIFQGDRSPAVLISRVASEPLVLKCSGQFVGNRLKVQLELTPTTAAVRGWWNGSEFNQARFPVGMARAIRPAAALNFDVKLLAAPAYLPEITRVLPSAGLGLSWILANLNLEQPARFKELVERLRTIVPVLENIRLQPAYVWQTEFEQRGAERVEVRRRYNGFELLFDMKGAEGLPAHAVSAGTLLSLGLLTVLASAEPPQLVLIDDLERGLHPIALRELVQQLRRLQEQNPDLQIVATSHSPYLLDYLTADEILLTSLDEEGYAAVRPLRDHPQYERWKDVMAPGEFWSTVGEKWVTEQAVK